MSKVIPELIHITSMNVYKASVSTSNEYLNEPKKFENIGVEYAQDTAFNFDDSAIRIRLEVKLDAVDEKNNSLGLSADYGIEFHFEVENFKDFVSEEKDTNKVSGLLGSTLMGIAYSTARGIVFDRTQGTFFKGIILPVIDPKGLVVK